MRAAERLPILLAKRQHAIPIVETPFLTEGERDRMTAAQASFDLPAEFTRASGECVCDVCGMPYWQHPQQNPHWYLHVLCSGRLVKL